MRLFLFIIFSLFSTQNISSYDPNNNGPNLLDQGNEQQENHNNDVPNKKIFFPKIEINNPILKLIIVGGAFVYLTYDSAREWLNSGEKSQKTPAQKAPEPISEPEPTLENGYYTVKIDGFTISMTEKEYEAYKKRWFKSDYFVENYQKFHSEGRIHSGRSVQTQPKPVQQKPIDTKPVQEQKPKTIAEAIPEKEEKYLIVREHLAKDFADFRDYNKRTRCWIEKIVDPSEVPDRYKKDLTVLSHDVFEMHEFNASELNDYIKEHNLTPSDWDTLYGNEIQKEIHLDSIRLLQQSRQPFKSIWMRENITELVQTIDVGRALNAQGCCTKASKVNNFCAALMDYSTTAWGNYAGGIQSRIPETIAQGVIVVGAIAAAVFVPGVAEAMLCYSTFQLGVDIGYTLGLAISDLPEHQAELNAKFKAITDRFKGGKHRTYKFEHSLGDFAYLGGEISADYTLMKTSGKLIKHAKKAAQKLRKFYKKRQGELVATTPDGQIFKVIDESTQNNHLQKKSDKKSGGGKHPQNANPDKTDGNKPKLDWTSHGDKHKVKTKGLSWKEIVKSTEGKKAKAKYRPDINIEKIEREGWEKGIPVKDGRWKVIDWGEVIGATEGVETQYGRIECSGNTIHGHPITYEEYRRLLKNEIEK